MSIEMYFINDTKKQVVSSKLLYADFEDNQQLLCYLSVCQGDTIRLLIEGSEWVEEFLCDRKHIEYKQIRLYEFSIYSDSSMYDNKEIDRLRAIILGTNKYVCCNEGTPKLCEPYVHMISQETGNQVDNK